ncbi:type II secretion system minor pseudopilin GspH [Aestuariibacter sp. A3R04]|uniref:type II secretion system minor pseudopilin GspH n=1 Tax=Aestuariibacter sp. A3R04 TaxID=2841571 RepID=UPI001C0993AC|nr:type II secretion system minor pseudopilin GspH [Aestuariibacter sp. A3R04]MBU3020358.1 type II secretion system minor pseudopilin GspH [Aestuariibacter sp. A3R04]
MSGPATISHPTSVRGFTLLEILLVITIMGLAAGYVVLNFFGVDQGEQLKKEGQRLQVLIDMASDYAVLNQKQMGIRFEPLEQAYYFVFLNEDDRWEKISDEKLYAEHTLDEPFRFELNLDDLPWDMDDQLFDRDIFDENFSLDDANTEIGNEEEKKLPPPQVLIMSSGEITPFTLTLSYEPDFSTDDPVYFQLQNQDVPPLLLDGPLEQPPE